MLTGVSGMNILFYRYGSICEPDIIQSLKGLGNNVDEITVEIYNKDFTPSEGVRLLTDTLFAHSYDFIFSINFYPFISEVCNIFHLRYICWTVDSPIAELYSSAICNPWNRIFLFDRAQYNTFHPPAIHPAGFLSFKLQHLLTFPVLQVTFPLLAPYTPKNAVFMN